MQISTEKEKLVALFVDIPMDLEERLQQRVARRGGRRGQKREVITQVLLKGIETLEQEEKEDQLAAS